MPSEHEIPMLVRHFTGIDRSQDAAFIGPSALQTSDGFVPSLTFLLSKRQGETLYRQLSVDDPGRLPGASITMKPLLVRTYDDSSNRFAIVVARSSLQAEGVFVSTNDGTFTFLFGFATNAPLYGAAQLGNRVYLGNGFDTLKSVILSGAPTVDTAPFAIGSFTNGAADPSPAADASALLFSGTYSYAWAVYDKTLKKWTQRSDTKTFTLRVGGASTLSFPIATGFTLGFAGADDKFHLFIAPVNEPIELASDQTPEGVTTGNTVISAISAERKGSAALPLLGAERTGNLLLPHRSRIWVSGDQTAGNGSRVYATNTILPGNEQSLFDQQPYFPQRNVLNVSRQDGDRITALGVAALTVTTDSPDAPLLIFKNASLWAFFGDFGSADAALVQLSGTIGCPAPFSVVTTPFGTLFVGLESVYLVRPDTLVPIDVGYPVNPLIRAIPVNRRVFSCAVYHRGFYKLAFTPVGSTANTLQVWLDLRRGLGSTPSWWGPHTAPAVVAFANARQDVLELDRGMDLQTKGNVRKLDQDNVYTDLVDDATGTTTQPIISRLRTASLDQEVPFDRKHFTRLRVNGRTNALATSVGLQLAVDGGMAFIEPPLAFIGSGGNAAWNSATWDVSKWTGSPVFHEAESIFSPDRPRGVSIDITLTHADPLPLDLRDLEIRELPVARPVA